jgi:hypothetical protein
LIKTRFLLKILCIYPITIILSSYFHIFQARAKHIFLCTCISKNLFKCILKHAIFQYNAMKSKNFLLLIIKIKIFMSSMCSGLIYGYFPPKNQVSLVGILDHASISVNNNAIPSFCYKP